MVEKKVYPVSSFQICVRLVQRDLLIFCRTSKRRFINRSLWMMVLMYVYEYIGFSKAAGFGLFVACGEFADYGFSNVFSRIVSLVADIRGTRVINYYLTLPVPQYMVFICIAISMFVQLLAIALVLLLVAKLVLLDRFDLARFSFIKAFFIFLSAYMFYGTLALLYTSMIKSIDSLNNVYFRVRETLFWTGCYFFTWQRLYEAHYVLAYLDLLNPFVYACEGMRMAIMGAESMLPFWSCCVVLLLCGALATYVGTRRLMMQLDCI